MTRPADCGDHEQEGCVDGTWYVPCGHPDCSGVCEMAGDCQCTGCDWDRCCQRPGGDR